MKRLLLLALQASLLIACGVALACASKGAHETPSDVETTLSATAGPTSTSATSAATGTAQPKRVSSG